MRGYSLEKENGHSVSADQNDPFHCYPAVVPDGEWFGAAGYDQKKRR